MEGSPPFPFGTSSSCSGKPQSKLSSPAANQPPAPMKSWNPAAQFGCSRPKPARWQPRLNLLLWEWLYSQTGLLNFIWRQAKVTRSWRERPDSHKFILIAGNSGASSRKNKIKSWKSISPPPSACSPLPGTWYALHPHRSTTTTAPSGPSQEASDTLIRACFDI